MSLKHKRVVKVVSNDSIQVKPRAKRNRYSMWLVTIILLLLSWISATLVGQTYPMAVVVSFSVTLVCAVIAWGKQQQPEFSFELTREVIEYHHPKGSWCIPWCSIQRVGCPTVYRQGEHITLPYVAVRLKNNSRGAILDSISPRLASNLLSRSERFYLMWKVIVPQAHASVRG